MGRRFLSAIYSTLVGCLSVTVLNMLQESMHTYTPLAHFRNKSSNLIYQHTDREVSKHIC